jgi:hypothetical protein
MLPETIGELLETREPECSKHEQLEVEMFQVEMDVTIVTRMLTISVVTVGLVTLMEGSEV